MYGGVFIPGKYPPRVHKHPALSRTLYIAPEDAAQYDALAKSVPAQLTSSWVVRVRHDLYERPLVEFNYGALGSYPSDHRKLLKWPMQRVTLEGIEMRHELCTHPVTYDSSQCDLPIEDCHAMIKQALKQLHDLEYDPYATTATTGRRKAFFVYDS